VANLKEDLEILKGEVQRCKNILEELCASSGNISGSSPNPTDIKNLIDSIVEDLRINTAEIDILGLPLLSALLIQAKPLSIALKALIKNALLAANHVTVIVNHDDTNLKIEVLDNGPGISADILPYVTEPFFSSRQDSSGMGLGAYIAKMIAIQLSGNIFYESKVGEYTKAIFIIPAKGVK
jgi:two-component system sensor histidine kinase RegB